jgi:hypothetical protein
MNGISESRLWDLGRTIRAPEKTAIAVIEIAVKVIEQSGLQCEAAPETQPVSYPEHGIIIGWDQEFKPKRLELQQKLAAGITRVVMPAPSASSNS